MMGLRGANRLGIHAHTCGSCREILHIQFSPDWRTPHDVFNDRSLEHDLHVFTFFGP